MILRFLVDSPCARFQQLGSGILQALHLSGMGSEIKTMAANMASEATLGSPEIQGRVWGASSHPQPQKAEQSLPKGVNRVLGSQTTLLALALEIPDARRWLHSSRRPGADDGMIRRSLVVPAFERALCA